MLIVVCCLSLLNVLRLLRCVLSVVIYCVACCVLFAVCCLLCVALELLRFRALFAIVYVVVCCGQVVDCGLLFAVWWRFNMLCVGLDCCVMC